MRNFSTRSRKSRKALVNFATPFRMCHCSSERIFLKFCIAEFDGNMSINSKFTYNRVKILGTLQEDLNIFPNFDKDIRTSDCTKKEQFSFLVEKMLLECACVVLG